MWSDEVCSYMSSYGLNEHELEQLHARVKKYACFCDQITDLITVNDGDIINTSAGELEIIHTPGHTVGSICLKHSSGVLFSGDTILKSIKPSALVEVARSQLHDDSYASLPAYLDSIEKLKHLDVRYVFAGHADYLEGLTDTISSYEEYHTSELQRTLRLIPKAGIVAHKLLEELYPNLLKRDTFLALSRGGAYIEMLLMQQKIKAARRDDQLSFSCVD